MKNKKGQQTMSLIKRCRESKLAAQNCGAILYGSISSHMSPKLTKELNSYLKIK